MIQDNVTRDYSFDRSHLGFGSEHGPYFGHNQRYCQFELPDPKVYLDRADLGWPSFGAT